MSTLRTVEGLMGLKHPESQAITEKIYNELTRKLLVRQEPSQMALKLDRKKLLPSVDVLMDSSIHPSLVKKRSENSLHLPKDVT
jgi:hypothetical protein